MQLPPYSPRLRHDSWESTLVILIKRVSDLLGRRPEEIKLEEVVPEQIFNSLVSRKDLRGKGSSLDWQPKLTIKDFVQDLWPGAKISIEIKGKSKRKK